MGGRDDLRSRLQEAARTGDWFGSTVANERLEVPAEWLAGLLTDTAGPPPRLLRLIGVTIHAPLDLTAATLRCPVTLRECRFTSPLLLREASAQFAELVRCELPGLDAAGLRTSSYLSLYGSRVTSDSLYGVDLHGAAIGGELEVSSASLEGITALYAPGAHVKGDLLAGALQAKGDVNLDDAHVDGRLEFLDVAVGTLSAYGLHVGGSAEFHNLTATGGITLHDAQIGGELILDRGDLQGPQLPDRRGLALAARGLHADRVTLHGASGRPFRAAGGADFSGGGVTGRLEVADGAELQEGGLLLRGAKLGELTVVADAVSGDLYDGVDLHNAQIGLLVQPVDPQGRWLPVVLDGCRYDRLQRVRVEKELVVDQADVEPDGPEGSVQWLATCQGERFRPQPYDQLADVYRRNGDDEAARAVLIAKQRQRRRTLRPAGQLGSVVLDWTVRFGYRPSLALWWLAGLWLIGVALFGLVFGVCSEPGCDVTPAKPLPPPFSAWAYSIDLLVPVFTVGQRGAWNAHGAAQVVATVWPVLGWVLTAAVAAGFAARRA